MILGLFGLTAICSQKHQLGQYAVIESILKATLLLVTTVLMSVVHAGPVSSQGTWETTLLARDLDGNGTTDAFYDTALNITWLKDANANGAMNWSEANSWANDLVVSGFSGWRLPNMAPGTTACIFSYQDTNCGYNVQTASSEMAHLWYDALGNKSLFDTIGNIDHTGCCLTNTGDFQNMQDFIYWFGTTNPNNANSAFRFGINHGYQELQDTNHQLFALAVHLGDIGTPMPEPDSMMLALAALASLGVVRRKWTLRFRQSLEQPI